MVNCTDRQDTTFPWLLLIYTCNHSMSLHVVPLNNFGDSEIPQGADLGKLDIVWLSTWLSRITRTRRWFAATALEAGCWNGQVMQTQEGVTNELNTDAATQGISWLLEAFQLVNLGTCWESDLFCWLEIQFGRMRTSDVDQFLVFALKDHWSLLDSK